MGSQGLKTNSWEITGAVVPWGMLMNSENSIGLMTSGK